MILSLGVLLVGVVLFVALLPKHDRDPVREVDVVPQLDVLARAAPYPVLAPRGLPPEWRPTSIRTTVPETRTGGTAELTIGYVVDRPSRTYAELDESNAPPEAFLRRELGDRPVTGSVRVGAVTYEERRDTAGHLALTRTANGVTVVVSDGGGRGGASREDLLVLAGSLRPQPR